MKRMAEVLRAKQEDILRAWKTAVLDDPRVPQAHRLKEPALRDSVPQLVAAIIDALELEEEGDEPAAGRKLADSFMPREHAQDRFAQGYTLGAAMREMSHLRTCMLDALFAEADVSSHGMRFFHAAVDECMTIAAVELELAAGRSLDAEQQRLREVGVVRERFLAIVGHDLRNPLNTISTAGALLLRMDLPEAQGSFVKRIVRATDRMIRIIDDLLDFAKVRSGALQIERRRADLRDVCNEVVDELRLVQPSRTILVDASGSFDGDWDVARAAQIVSNLAANALAYSPEQSTVRVVMRSNDADVTIEVHNEGTPIPEEEQAHLFEPFRRGPGEGRNTHGVGLGLFIASEMVRAHGGTIAVQSTREQGTTFTLRLPRRVVIAQGGDG